jgi:hypothetical protein
MSPAMTGDDVPRSDNRGTCCSAVQRCAPSEAARPTMRPSTPRTTTRSSSTAGAARISVLMRVFQRCFPVVVSKATTSPNVEPTTTIPPPAPGPPASCRRVFVRHRRLPFAIEKAATSPSWFAANARSPSTATPSPRRSLGAPPPTPADQLRWTWIFASISVSSAGGSMFLFFEQAASSRIVAASSTAGNFMASHRPAGR